MKSNKTKEAKQGEVKPTAAELAILQVIWELGSATVREVNETMNAKQPQGYTTTLKQMQIMREKGLLERDESTGAHIYRAGEAKQKMQQRIVGDLIDKAFGGSWASMMMQAVSSKCASRQELAEIKRMIESFEQENEKQDEPS
jgi:predicted transcriptional regulator